MKGKELMAIAIVVSIASLVMQAKFEWGLFSSVQEKLHILSLMDMCEGGLSPHWNDIQVGTYDYVTGYLSSGETITLPANSKIDTVFISPKKRSYGEKDMKMNLRLCNDGNCYIWRGNAETYTYANSRSDCISDCTSYNWPAQCQYGHQLPSYTCTNLCDYETGLGNVFVNLPQRAGSMYTLTVTESFEKMDDGTWVQGGSPPQMAYWIGYWVDSAPAKSACPTRSWEVGDNGMVTQSGWDETMVKCCNENWYEDSEECGTPAPPPTDLLFLSIGGAGMFFVFLYLIMKNKRR